MSYTLNENGIALTETRDGVTMPVDCSFEYELAEHYGVTQPAIG